MPFKCESLEFEGDWDAAPQKLGLTPSVLGHARVPRVISVVVRRSMVIALSWRSMRHGSVRQVFTLPSKTGHPQTHLDAHSLDPAGSFLGGLPTPACQFRPRLPHHSRHLRPFTGADLPPMCAKSSRSVGLRRGRGAKLVIYVEPEEEQIVVAVLALEQITVDLVVAIVGIDE